MHSLEGNERGDAFAPHRLKCASGVTHTVFCVTAADRVGNPARELLHTRVPAPRAITANQIGAARNFAEQSRNVGWIILQIAINQNQSRATSSLKSGVHRGALPSIFFKT